MRLNHALAENRRFALVTVLAVLFERTQERISRIIAENFLERRIFADVTVNFDVFVVSVVQSLLCGLKFLIATVVDLNVDNFADGIAHFHSQKHLSTVFGIDFDGFGLHAVIKFEFAILNEETRRASILNISNLLQQRNFSSTRQINSRQRPHNFA